MRPGLLTRRALGRATLARQLLLRRSEIDVIGAVEHVVGLQAQVPLDPYTGLWSRLERFRPETLSDHLTERRVVRIVVMRGTIHLVTADDALVLRPLMQPVLDAELARHRDYAPLLRGVDLEPILETASRLLAERAPDRAGAARRARGRFPAHDAAALAYACRCRLALVQVPPRGIWGRSSQVRVTTLASWLGRPLAAEPSLDEMVLRYLAAFGPASVADVTTWCRLTGMREVVERLRPRLETLRDEDGRELFDLPGAPRPDADVPAPPRFLPEYDNVLLSHADRSRFVAGGPRRAPARGRSSATARCCTTGSLRGVWRLERDRRRPATRRWPCSSDGACRSARRRRSRPRGAATCGSPRPTPGVVRFESTSPDAELFHLPSAVGVPPRDREMLLVTLTHVMRDR